MSVSNLSIVHRTMRRCVSTVEGRLYLFTLVVSEAVVSEADEKLTSAVTPCVSTCFRPSAQ